MAVQVHLRKCVWPRLKLASTTRHLSTLSSRKWIPRSPADVRYLHSRSKSTGGTTTHPRPPAVDFNCPEAATSGKSGWEVFRGWLAFKLFTYNYLVDNSFKLYNFSRRLLGRWLTERLLQETILGQFVSGIDEEDTARVARQLAQRNIASIWNYSSEQTISEGDQLADPNTVREQEREYDEVNEHYLKSVELSASINLDIPAKFAAVKLTAIVNPHLLGKVSSILRASEELFLSLASPSDNILERTLTSEQLQEVLPGTTLKTDRSSAISLVEWMAHFNLYQNAPLLVQLLSKRSSEFALTELDEAQLCSFVQRVRAIGECALAQGVRVLMDAEQSYFQPTIHHLTSHFLTPLFNQDSPTIYNTLQTYLTSSYDKLLVDLATAKHYGAIYGVKVVRGAYMEEERKLAASLGLPSPIHPDKPSTDRSYHRALEHILGEVARGNAGVMVAGHNKGTVELALRKINKLELSPLDGSVVFGQLLGMGDHLTYPLAQAGYIANKILAYGPVGSVFPYLVRRAQENRGLMENARAERLLYMQEMKRRVGFGKRK